MEQNNLERKYNILKMRLSNLIEEHAEALSMAQHYALRVRELEEKLENVEKEKMESAKD